MSEVVKPQFQPFMAIKIEQFINILTVERLVCKNGTQEILARIIECVIIILIGIKKEDL